MVSEHGKAKLVIANNVIANVPHPSDFFGGIRTLMAADGYFVWETGYVRYLAENCVFDNVHHEHIDYYAARPLVQFYSRLGLQLFDVETTDSKGASLRSFVQHAGGRASVSPSVASLIKHEEEAGYFDCRTYRQLGDKLERIKAELHEKLSEFRAKGKVVSGYGAAIGSTTILYHFDLGQQLQFLIDDNAVRHGLLSPGLALPVESPAVLHGPKRPDVVAILAWRYKDAIVGRNTTYLDSGGKFIQILPDVRVLDRGGD
jgi:hypothetical protein